jgi:hypothetical protein
MVTQLPIAWCLMALCVTVHADGVAGAFRWIDRSAELVDRRFWPPTWLLNGHGG